MRRYFRSDPFTYRYFPVWAGFRFYSTINVYQHALQRIHNPARTFALTDLDDTVLTTHYRAPTNHLTSDYPGEAYFGAVAAMIGRCPPDTRDALFSMLMRDYRFGQRFAHPELTQPGVRDAITLCKKMRIPIFGFTARGRDACPSHLLQSLALSFHQLPKDTFEVGPHSSDPHKSIHFVKGSVLLDDACKGHGLKLFYQHPETRACLKDRDEVIFIDDKKGHCEAVEEAAQALGIKAHVYHYPYVKTMRQMQNMPEEKALKEMSRQADLMQAAVFERFKRK